MKRKELGKSYNNIKEKYKLYIEVCNRLADDEIEYYVPVYNVDKRYPYASLTDITYSKTKSYKHILYEFQIRRDNLFIPIATVDYLSGDGKFRKQLMDLIDEGDY